MEWPERQRQNYYRKMQKDYKETQNGRGDVTWPQQSIYNYKSTQKNCRNIQNRYKDVQNNYKNM